MATHTKRARERAIPCARTCAVFALCALALVGCPEPAPPDGSDGGPPRDAASVGRVVVEVSGAEETLEDDVVLERLRLGLTEVRAQNDRGGALEPSQRDLGTLDLTSAPARVELVGAVPATYSSVQLTLSGDPALELRLTEGETTWELVTRGPIVAEIRCDLPVVLPPEGALGISVALDLGELHVALREAELPPPIDGVVRVDETTAPALVAELEALAAEHWQVECDDDDDVLDD